MLLSLRRSRRYLIPIVALSMLAVACGSDGDGEATGGDAAGTVIVSGSSTVEPISSLVADFLAEENDGVEVTVDGPGTGDGFKLFCDGETDISDASRAIKPEEAAACEANGIEFIELKVAFDGLTVMTNSDNDIECLSFADLYALVGPESTAKRWTDASALAAELGSDTTFPDKELTIVAPGEESGTYDSFIELALADVAEERVAAGKLTEEEAGSTRADYQASANDNVIIEGMADDGSFGWVGFAFAEEAGDSVREIAVSEEPGGACVEPSAEAISDGTYPLARPLFIYVNKAKAEENEAVAAYVDYYLSDAGLAAVAEAGYVDLDEASLEATQTAWTDRTVGSREG